MRDDILASKEAEKVEWQRAFAMGGIVKDPSVPGQLVYVTPLRTYLILVAGMYTPLRAYLQRREPSQRFNTFSASIFQCQVGECKAPVRVQLCLVEAETGTPLRRWTYCELCGGTIRTELEMIAYIEGELHGEEAR